MKKRSFSLVAFAMGIAGSMFIACSTTRHTGASGDGLPEAGEQMSCKAH